MPDPTPPPAPRLAELPASVIAEEQTTVYLGDAVELLPLLPEASIDALVTDPPYGLSFNGHSWDDASGFRESLPHMDTSAMTAPEVFEAWCKAWAAGALHALKPGAYVAAFGGARTWHRMVRGIENAGFEIRDQIAWLHTTGMPKSMDLAHAIDKHHGVHRTDRIVQTNDHDGVLGVTRTVVSKGTPVTDDAQRDLWGFRACIECCKTPTTREMSSTGVSVTTGHTNGSSNQKFGTKCSPFFAPTPSPGSARKSMITT